MKIKLLTILGLILFSIIIILPPIIHGYIYPNVGDDSAAHLEIIEKIQSGNADWYRFSTSYKLVGYPVAWISNLTGINISSLFLWFNYISLIMVGIVLYLVFSRLISRIAGWIALILVLFSAQSALFQFYYGQIFNLINVGLIFPLLLYSSIMYLRNKRIVYLIIAILLSALFGSFHMSGIYLPVLAVFATSIYLIYCLVKKKSINRQSIILGSSIILMSVIAFIALIYTPWRVVIESLSSGENIFSIIIYNITHSIAVPIVPYLKDLVSPTVLILFVLCGVYYSTITVRTKSKDILFILYSLIIILAVASFGKLSLDPFRQALDLATVLAMFVAVSVSILLKTKNKANYIIVGLAIAFAMFHSLPTWFDYNSAIRQSDKQTISYLNKSDSKTFSCSGELAYWVYERFTDKQWIKENGDLLIIRSKPMTPRSTKDNMWYENHGTTLNDNYTLVEMFNDNKVNILVYERND